MTAHQDPTANQSGDSSFDKSAEHGAAQGQSDATAQAEAQPLDPIAQLQAELVTAQAQLSEYKDQVLRAHAEMENVRRRAQDERFPRHVNSGLSRSLRGLCR
jgi:molecular chaperone GrpE